MATDRPAQENEEIEVTPEMIEVGFDYLILSAEGDVSLEDYRESVAVVFSALRRSGWDVCPPSRERRC